MSRQINLTDAEFMALKDVLKDAVDTGMDILTDVEIESTRSEIREQKKYVTFLERILGKLRETADSR